MLVELLKSFGVGATFIAAVSAIFYFVETVPIAPYILLVPVVVSYTIMIGAIIRVAFFSKDDDSGYMG